MMALLQRQVSTPRKRPALLATGGAQAMAEVAEELKFQQKWFNENRPRWMPYLSQEAKQYRGVQPFSMQKAQELEDYLKGIGAFKGRPEFLEAFDVSDLMQDLAKAANDAAEAASLQRIAAEISLESHGYEPIRRLGGSTTATVMVVQRLGMPEQQFVVKAMALRGMDEQERRRALQEVKILKKNEEDSHKLVARVDLFLKRRGVH
eukprot:g16682.t1